MKEQRAIQAENKRRMNARLEAIRSGKRTWTKPSILLPAKAKRSTLPPVRAKADASEVKRRLSPTPQAHCFHLRDQREPVSTL